MSLFCGWLRKTAALTLVAVFLTTLPGCAEATDLDRLAVVLTLGIDLEEDGQLLVTVQLAKPSVARSPSLGGGSQGDSVDKSPIIPISERGRSFQEAMVKIHAELSRRLTLTHCLLIVIGESLGVSGIGPFLDSALRDSTLRPSTTLLVCRGTAREFLKTVDLGMEATQSMGTMRMLREAQSVGKAADICVGDFVAQMSSPSRSAAIPIIEVVDQEGKCLPKIGGTAIFLADKWIGEFDEAKTRGLVWVGGSAKDGVIVVDVVPEIIVTLLITRVVAESKPEIQGTKATIKVKLDLRSRVASCVSSTALPPLSKVEALAEDLVKDDILSAFRHAADLDADPFGFITQLQGRFPKRWKETDAYSYGLLGTDLEIDVALTIQDTGAIIWGIPEFESQSPR